MTNGVVKQKSKKRMPLRRRKRKGGRGWTCPLSLPMPLLRQQKSPRTAAAYATLFLWRFLKAALHLARTIHHLHPPPHHDEKENNEKESKHHRTTAVAFPTTYTLPSLHFSFPIREKHALSSHRNPPRPPLPQQTRVPHQRRRPRRPGVLEKTHLPIGTPPPKTVFPDTTPEPKMLPKRTIARRRMKSTTTANA